MKKSKDNILKLTLSILLIVFGLILLLDQLDLPSLAGFDDFFTPWYTIVILFFSACALAYAIIKKAPIMYIIAMFFAGIYLVVAIEAKVETFNNANVWKIIAIIPLFCGIGLVLADKICKWSPKASRFGFVVAIASAIVLVSTILNSWRYIIPSVIIMIGITYFIFELLSLKDKSKKVEDDHYVTYTPKEENTAEKEQPTQNNEECAETNNDLFNGENTENID